MRRSSLSILGGIRPERSQHKRTGREDRRLNFYSRWDNPLAKAEAVSADLARQAEYGRWDAMERNNEQSKKGI